MGVNPRLELIHLLQQVKPLRGELKIHDLFHISCLVLPQQHQSLLISI